MAINYLTDETFDLFLQNASQPVVVLFHAPWCEECNPIRQQVAQLAAENGHLQFAEVDTEEAMEVAARFDIRGIPTLLVFERGRMVDRLYSREARFAQNVDEFIASLVESDTQTSAG
ncbi:MAG: thioredoxin family protein [Bacillota bacterium]|nr:thioredoxin family protein [Bacillota bacterium]